ncbi:hypothetical protein B0O80DRAFT_154616 [Mortierella sp. GBAus27b]|nr:hypothetical protein B0O80DRAFT_154616 [Mortierella sp. GBAus27b]
MEYDGDGEYSCGSVSDQDTALVPMVPCSANQPCLADGREFVDLSRIIAGSKSDNRAIAFARMNYGMCRMSETVAITPQTMAHRFERHNVLYVLGPSEQGHGGVELEGSRTVRSYSRTITLLSADLFVMLSEALNGQENRDKPNTTNNQMGPLQDLCCREGLLYRATPSKQNKTRQIPPMVGVTSAVLTVSIIVPRTKGSDIPLLSEDHSARDVHHVYGHSGNRG